MAVCEIEKPDWKQIEKEITCPICERVFTDPKTTPCLHTFCKECLEIRIEASRVLSIATFCPLCRKDLPQPSNYPSDFRIKRLIELFSKHQLESKKTPVDAFCRCGKCEEEVETVSWCVECQVLLCHDCHEIHGKWKEFKAHTTVTLEEFINHPSDFVVRQPSR